MSHAWETSALLFACLFWGVFGVCCLARELRRPLTRLVAWAEASPVGALVCALAVGIAVAYGGSKPQPPVEPDDPEEPEIWSVSFDAAGGTGTYGPFEFPVGQAKRLEPCSLVREGYLFAGWSATPNGDLMWEDGAMVRSESPVSKTVHAVWIKMGCYAIAFDPDDGAEGSAWTMSRLDVAPGKVAKLPPCTFVPPTGRKFAGWLWNRTPSVESRRYDDGMLVFNLADEPARILVFQAIWEPATR